MPTGGTRRKRAQLTMSAKKPDHQSQVKTEEERAFAQMIPACAFDVLTEPDDQSKDVVRKRCKLLTLNSPDPFSFGRTRFRKGDEYVDRKRLPYRSWFLRRSGGSMGRAHQAAVELGYEGRVYG
ncbi:hypothetical protein C8Q77DRAFT_764424 [Trametes polyzona]|nr:hypothetical protein C8Q77DRAFT_764424 [Trametes polyzona]